MTRTLSRPALLLLPALASVGLVFAALGMAAGPYTGRATSGERGRNCLGDHSLYESLQAAATRARYAVEPEAPAINGSLAGGNPAHALRLRFTPAAVELSHVARAATTADGAQTKRTEHHLRVAVAGLGRGAARSRVRAGAPIASGNRVDAVHRVAGVTISEWFVNDPEGLEQGFVLDSRPAGIDGPVTLALRVAGDLTPEVAADGSHATLRDATGQVILDYRGLKVWDAAGTVLPSRLEPGLDSSEMVIAVSDTNAVYPVTIDPIWVQQAQFTGSDAVNGDRFGNAIALDGNTAIVGSYLDNTGFADAGCAFVFTRSGTTWTQQAKLVAGDPAASDEFGVSVGLSGNTAIVGAHLDNGAFADMGSAYVFLRTGTSWAQQAKLTASDGALSDEFGISVDVDGDTAVVGAYFDDEGANSNQGSVYVFLRTGVAWAQQAKITAADGAAGDRLGSGVAVNGDDLIAGAYQDNVTATDQGSAYVFVRSGVTWSQQQRLTASDPLALDQFGWSVALDGDTAVVGANEADVGGNVDQGAAYAFFRSGVTWTQQSKLVAGDGAASDNLGWSVGVDEASDTAVVGAALDDGSNVDQGSAYTFIRSSGTWSQQQKLSDASGVTNAHFGSGVAVDGDYVVVGAERQNSVTPAGTNNGTVYAYLSHPDPPVITNVTASEVGKTTATITWTTDVASSSTVQYGLTGAFGSTATGASGINHNVTITSLTAGRTYHFRVRSITVGGSAPTSEGVSPASGSQLFVTAPDVGTVVIGFAMRRLAGTIFLTVTVTNTGGTPVTDAVLNTATLTGTSTGTPSTPALPLSVGAIAGNSSVTATLQYSGGLGVAGGSGVLNFGFESSDGTIGVGYRTTLP